MNHREQEQREGERLTDLQALGRDSGAGGTIWARVILDELDRHDAAKDRFLAKASDGKDWDRFHGTGLVIALAIGQVLAFEERLRSLTGDAELAKARRNFDRIAPHAQSIRHLVAHLDEYAVGGGLRQKGEPTTRHGAPIAERNVRHIIIWTESGESYLSVAGEQQSLHEVACAAVALSEIMEQVREKHAKRTLKRLIAASGRADVQGLP